MQIKAIPKIICYYDADLTGSPSDRRFTSRYCKNC